MSTTKVKKYKYTFFYPDFEYGVDENTEIKINKIKVDKQGGWYNEGMAQLGSIIENAGWEVDLVDILYPYPKEKILEEIEKRKPDVIGIGVRTDVYQYCEKLAGWLAGKGIHVMAGSYHASLFPEKVINWKGIDSLIVGEAELPMMEFLKRWPNLGDYKIGSFWFKTKNGNIIKNKPIGLIEDLDTLPLPKFDLFDFENLLSSRSNSVIALITRGCPYKCTYCWNNYHSSIYPKGVKYVRYRSAKNAIEYLKGLMNTFPKVERFRFLDDILPVYQSWRNELKELYLREVNIPFSCNYRANFMDEATAKFLKEMGCIYIFFGVESGNQEILDKVLKRNLKKEVVVKAFKACKKVGIKIGSYNMVGLPFETPKTALDTIKFNAILKPNHIFAGIYCPYPKTELDEMSINAGFYDPEKPRKKYVNVQMKDYKEDMILFNMCYFREFKNMYMIAYIFPKPISTILEKFIDSIYYSKLVPRNFLSALKLKVREVRGNIYYYIKYNFPFLYRTGQHLLGK